MEKKSLLELGLECNTQRLIGHTERLDAQDDELIIHQLHLKALQDHHVDHNRRLDAHQKHMDDEAARVQSLSILVSTLKEQMGDTPAKTCHGEFLKANEECSRLLEDLAKITQERDDWKIAFEQSQGWAETLRQQWNILQIDLAAFLKQRDEAVANTSRLQQNLADSRESNRLQRQELEATKALVAGRTAEVNRLRAELDKAVQRGNSYLNAYAGVARQARDLHDDCVKARAAARGCYSVLKMYGVPVGSMLSIAMKNIVEEYPWITEKL